MLGVTKWGTILWFRKTMKPAWTSVPQASMAFLVVDFFQGFVGKGDQAPERSRRALSTSAASAFRANCDGPDDRLGTDWQWNKEDFPQSRSSTPYRLTRPPVSHSCWAVEEYVAPEDRRHAQLNRHQRRYTLAFTAQTNSNTHPTSRDSTYYTYCRE